MKRVKFMLVAIVVLAMISCTNGDTKSSNTTTSSNTGTDYYFTYSIDGKEFSLNPETDVTTSYNAFGKDDKVFKIFAGKDNAESLTLTIPTDVSKPVSIPSGGEVGTEIAQGSVSLQGYPQKGYVFNSHDFMDATTKSDIKPDAIKITEVKIVDSKIRIITGELNVVTVPGENKSNDPNFKPYIIKGKFRIKSDKFFD